MLGQLTLRLRVQSVMLLQKKGPVQPKQVEHLSGKLLQQETQKCKQVAYKHKRN